MILCVLQARMSSSRLPGKVLKPILGRPMLSLQVERIKKSKRIDKLIVATSIDKSDDAIEEFCGDEGLSCFRGSLDDVLDRYYQASIIESPDHVVRLTGDCPVLDPEILDEMIEYYLDSQFDYVCNTQKPTFPDGLDAWIFSFDVLERSWKNAKLPSEREHVTAYIKNHPSDFKIGSFESDVDYSSHRWTVDEIEDYELVSKIYEYLYPKNKNFDMNHILQFEANNSEVFSINNKFERDEGLKRSLMKDEVMSEIPESLSMQDRAKKVIAGGNHLLSKRVDQFSEGVWPGYFSKAKGAKVWDLDGNEYIDMSIGGIGATILGYADDEVDAAVKNVVAQGIASSLNAPEEVQLAELLCEINPWAQLVRLARTGGEANAIAIRIARAYTNKDVVAFCGYHGWHDWYLSSNISHESNLEGHLLKGLSPNGVPNALRDTAFPFRYNNIEDLDKILEQYKDRVGVIIMEPLRNHWPTEDFLQKVKERAELHGCVLIFDEISSGFRMNSSGAHQLLGVDPDIAVYSKALGNGYPIAAVVGRQAVMEAIDKTFVSSTCWTERTGPAAALATIRKHMREDVSAHLNNIGKKVQDGWKEIAASCGIEVDVGGIAPLSHFTFCIEGQHHLELKAYYVQEMLQEGYLASNIFYAMFAHSLDDVDGYLKETDRVWHQMTDIIASGKSIASCLKGKPSVSGFSRLT